MARRTKVFLLHGMGEHPTSGPEAWHLPWITGLNRAAERFALYASREHDLTRVVDFVPITYDQHFVAYWNSIDASGSLADQSAFIESILGAGLGGAFDELLTGSKAQEDFFWRNWADVLAWQFLPPVRSYVIAHVIQDLYAQQKSGSCCIIAHSLGAAVLHGALHGMASAGIGWNPRTMRVRCLALLASVAGALDADSHPAYVSPVREGRAPDYCDDLVHLHHRLDPFTWFRTYDATRAGGNDRCLEGLSHGSDISQIHTVGEYLKHPAVATYLLRSIAPPRTRAERQRFRADYAEWMAEWKASAWSVDDPEDLWPMLDASDTLSAWFKNLVRTDVVPAP